MFYASFNKAIKRYKSPEIRLAIYEAITNYAIDGVQPDEKTADERVLSAFDVIKPIIDTNTKKRKGGSKGGRHTNTDDEPEVSDTKNHRLHDCKTIGYENENHRLQKSASNVNVNVNVNDNVNANEHVNVNANADVDNTSSSDEEDESAEPTTASRQRVPYQEVVDLYNSVCISLPRVREVSNSRRKAIRSRYKKYGIEGIETVFHMAEESDFLTGRTGNGKWTASFDWIMKQSNFLKILEENYANRTKSAVDNPFLNMLAEEIEKGDDD